MGTGIPGEVAAAELGGSGPRPPPQRGGEQTLGPAGLTLLSPQYMGCVEVLQSMRALDFNTRTQVTR